MFAGGAVVVGAVVAILPAEEAVIGAVGATAGPGSYTGVRVDAGVSPQVTSSKMNAAGRGVDIVSFILISLPPLYLAPHGSPSR